MIEARSILIRAGKGRVRVLRLAGDGRHTYPARYTVWWGGGVCRSCGCTEQIACMGGCAWVNAARTRCSRCDERILT